MSSYLSKRRTGIPCSGRGIVKAKEVSNYVVKVADAVLGLRGHGVKESKVDTTMAKKAANAALCQVRWQKI